MNVPEFNEKELVVVSEKPNFVGGKDAIFSYPVTPKEAGLGLYNGRPVWESMAGIGVETIIFNPTIIPDNIARALAFDATIVPGASNLSGGTDMFGIEWEYVPVAQGSIVKPGHPLISDANEIEDKVVWPNIDEWPWAESQEANRDYLNPDYFVSSTFFTGYFERLISFMDFEEAVVAMIDDDQKDAVKDFFDKLTDLYISIFDKMFRYFPELDVINFHDDWGSQQNAFFSASVVEEMLVPYMKRLTDFIHSKGKIADLHSCGNLAIQVPNMIAAGWDSWTPQPMNDFDKLYDNYGDKLILAVMPEWFDPQTTTEPEQREYAKAFAERYCNPAKPTLLNMYALTDVKETVLTRVYQEELYKQSRIKYSGAK